MSAPALTVVICTHNRVQLLAHAIASLNVAVRPSCGAQLLVVANNCSDGTHDYLATYGQRADETLPLRWLTEPRPGKSHALNTAVGNIDTELAALVDDDQRPGERFLELACAAADRLPEADILMGKVVPDWTGNEPQWIHDTQRYRIYPLPVPQIEFGESEFWCDMQTAVPSGGNAIVRRRIWSRVGPFSTALGPVGHNLAGGEDTEWFLRAMRQGARVRYVPELVQYHYVDPDRLTLRFMLRFAFERTAAAVSVGEDGRLPDRTPVWAYRKLARYVGAAALSMSTARRRFYLVRAAASLGEIAGYRRKRQSA